MGNMDRLESIVARLPEVARVDIEAWGGEPTFRVAGKNFVFAGTDGRLITLKPPWTKPRQWSRPILRSSPRDTGSVARVGSR